VSDLHSTATLAAEGPSAVLDRIAGLIRRAGGGVPTAVGIGSPGPVDRDGIVREPPNLPGWSAVDLASELSARLGLDRAAVHVENDANAFALGESLIGVGVGRESLFAVTLGTGIGGALVLDGKLMRGASGVAGEIGHTTLRPDGPRCGCGRLGCLETFASATALVRRAREATGISGDLDGQTIVDAAVEGNESMRTVIAEVGRDLGLGLVDAIHMVDPDVIVIGGGLRHAGEMLLEPARECIRLEALLPARDVELVASRLGPTAAIVGAVAAIW